MDTQDESDDDIFSKFVERDRVVVREAIEILKNWDEDRAKSWVKESI